jgi:hypothetical protein
MKLATAPMEALGLLGEVLILALQMVAAVVVTMVATLLVAAVVKDLRAALLRRFTSRSRTTGACKSPGKTRKG